LVDLPRCKNGQRHTIFLLDKPPAQRARKVKSGIHMFATIVGGALALVFVGLPLAIIGLFIQSFFEGARPAMSHKGSKPIDFERIVDQARTGAKAAPPHRPNTLGGLVALIVARHDETAAPVRAPDNGGTERDGTISNPRSMVVAASFPADSSAPTRVGDHGA
jgi:hypothetical protein